MSRPETFSLLAYNDANDYMLALEWTGDPIQHEVDSTGLYVDGWSHDYSEPKEPGLWFCSGTVEGQAPVGIEWRRLTADELTAVAAGVWPLPSAASTSSADGHWSYDGEGFETHNSAEKARDAAERALDDWRDQAVDGWDEEAASVAWGEISEVATSCNFRRHRPECAPEECAHLCEVGSPELDSAVDYKLAPVSR